MSPNRVSTALAIVGGMIGGIVFISELAYWLAHLRHPGPAVYIALSGLAIMILSISQLTERPT
jgi:hypothetical protein